MMCEEEDTALPQASEANQTALAVQKDGPRVLCVPFCSPNCSASIFTIPWPLPSFALPVSPGSRAVTVDSRLMGNLEISTLQSHPG